MHLATLLELQAAHNVTCSIATYDDGLLRAAECLGFESAFAVKEKAGVKVEVKDGDKTDNEADTEPAEKKT